LTSNPIHRRAARREEAQASRVTVVVQSAVAYNYHYFADDKCMETGHLYIAIDILNTWI